MIEFLIGLSISSLWIVLAGIAVLFVLRTVAVLIAKPDWKRALGILFLPFSIGYFTILPRKTWLSRVYRLLVPVIFFFALLASFWVFYSHFA